MSTLKTASLKHHFLIAMPDMADPNFAHTITYICDHNDEGAMGIVVNRPMELTVADILTHLQITEFDDRLLDQHVLYGGPVQTERGFVLHRTLPHKWDTTLCVDDDICLTTSRDILVAIANNEGPAESLVALGYAGWGPGQLEGEIQANGWLTCDANFDLVFRRGDGDKWQAALASIGISPSFLSSAGGNA